MTDIEQRLLKHIKAHFIEVRFFCIIKKIIDIGENKDIHIFMKKVLLSILIALSVSAGAQQTHKFERLSEDGFSLHQWRNVLGTSDGNIVLMEECFDKGVAEEETPDRLIGFNLMFDDNAGNFVMAYVNNDYNYVFVKMDIYGKIISMNRTDIRKYRSKHIEDKLSLYMERNLCYTDACSAGTASQNTIA